MAESGVLRDFAGGDVPSSFFDVVRIFQSHLASLRVDPGRLDAVRESRTFRLCLHCIAHRISVCGYLTYKCTSFSKHHAELVRLGFVPPPSEDFITDGEKERSDRQKEKAVLTGLLDQAGRLGLRQDVDNVTRACQLDLEVRRLMSSVNREEYSGRWDQILRYKVRVVHLLAERHEAWPSWPDLDKSRRQIMDPVTVYGREDRDVAEWMVLLRLLDVSYNFLPPHAADVRKHVNFHSRYLDQEVARMGRLLAELSDTRDPRLISRLIAAENAEFCSMMIRSDFGAPSLTKMFTLRLYRLCLNVEESDLADTVMKISFMKNPDGQQLKDLLNQLLASLRSNANQPTNRIILNAEHDDGGAGRLPELLPVMDESQQDEPQLRCVKEFQERNRNVQPVQKIPPVKPSASSSATTIKPSSSQLLREERELIALRKDLALISAPDPLSENRKVARIFTVANSIRDSDCNNDRFFYIQRAVVNPVILKYEGSCRVQEIKTNIATGVPYHCSVLTYHPAQDEWSVTSNMCRISGPLAVELEGATCVPFLGDCGDVVFYDDSFVFKFRKSRTECALREYMADVRTQSTASWYVNRFRELSQDRFGVLEMLYSDCVVVYQDSRRDTILELMTREIMFRSTDAIKFNKYTNNMSYRNRRVNTDLLEAFSHFTNHHTNEILMVTDLQGWVSWDEARDNINYTLTDPVIHCLGEPYRFGGTNRRYEGMAQFFQHVHPTCNHICEFLNLTRPEEFRVPENTQSDPTGPEEFRVPENTQPGLTRREKPEKTRSLPKRVSSRSTNNPYKRPRLGSP